MSLSPNQRDIIKRLRFDVVTLLAHALGRPAEDGKTVRAYDLKLISTAISSFRSETLRIIRDSSMTAKARRGLAGGVQLGFTETNVIDYIHVISRLGDDMNDIAIGHIAAFGHYSGLVPYAFGEPYPSERISQTVAILRVIKHLERNDIDMWVWDDEGEGSASYPFIHDSNLRDLVLNSGEHREAVVSIITERSIFDADEISEMIALDNHTALLGGTL